MKTWTQNALGGYELHFSPYDKDEIIFIFIQDCADKTRYSFMSELLGIEYDRQHFDSMDEAKCEFEEMVANYYEDQANYYEELLEKFRS